MIVSTEIYMQALLVAGASFALFIIGALVVCWFYGGYLLKKDKQASKL